VSCFLEVTKGKIVPAGSVVVLFSASHLQMSGLSGFIADLCSEVNRVERVFRGGVIGFPGVPVFLSGCADRGLTRSLIEFDRWLRHTGDQFPAVAWEHLVRGIETGNSGGFFLSERMKLRIDRKSVV